jgi:multidrug efflux pump subunit AcrA (membrane-fusion protein)
VIVIIGTQSFEVESTLSSGQVPNVKVGQPADIEIDGKSDPNTGTVSQVGPVESTSDGYSYPVVATLPASVQGLFAGSTANMTITTGGVHDVVAVPTSAVITNASTHYVDMLKNGTIARHVVKIGMVGSTYTQITSGLHVGQSVVLADLSEAVPSSNTATLGGLGGGGGFPGGATFQRVGQGGPGGVVSVNIAP